MLNNFQENAMKVGGAILGAPGKALDSTATAVGKTIMKTPLSVGKSINMGMDLGLGRGLRANGLGSMLGFGMIGASLGAASSVFSEGGINPVVGAAVGGTVGALAAPLSGVAMGMVGKGVIGTAKAMPSIIGGVGSGVLAATPYLAGVASYGAAKVGGGIWNVGSRLINWKEDADAFNKVKISGLGKTLLAGGALMEGVRDSYNKVMESKMGMNMGIQTMTPRIPSYANDGGATGDLVFALNANRRGVR